MRSFPGIEFRLRKMLPKPVVDSRTRKRFAPYRSSTPRVSERSTPDLKAPWGIDKLWCNAESMRQTSELANLIKARQLGSPFRKFLVRVNLSKKPSRSFNLNTLQCWRRPRSEAQSPGEKIHNEKGSIPFKDVFTRARKGYTGGTQIPEMSN